MTLGEISGMLSLMPPISFNAVSYTHLLFMFTHQKNKQRHLARHTGQAGAGTVSYTHLDVYKRQV